MLECACADAYATRRLVSPVVLTAPPVTAPPGRQDRRERGFTGRAVDHPAAGVAGRAESIGQAQQLAHPVEHHRLDLGARRAGDPAHSLHAQAGRCQLAEDRAVRRVAGEVGEEAGMLPVGDARHDDTVEVGQHVGERLGLGRRVFGQHRPNVAGLDLRSHRVLLDALHVVGDPVDQRVAVHCGGCRRRDEFEQCPLAGVTPSSSTPVTAPACRSRPP